MRTPNRINTNKVTMGMHRYWVTKRTVFNSSVGLGVANSVIFLFLFLPMVFGIRMAISKGAFLFLSRKERMAGVLQPGKNLRVISNGMLVQFPKTKRNFAFRILTILLYRKIIRESVLVLRTYYYLSPPGAL